MTEKIYGKEEWESALKGLSRSYSLYVPVKEGDIHFFREFKDGVKTAFDFDNTRMSAKEIVYPQTERMFDYNIDAGREDSNVLKESEKDFPPQAIVGIRPCDAHAFVLVKRNFDTPEFQDPWWIKRYESTTLVGLGCNAPSATCFCTSAGGGPYNEQGLDVMLYDLGDRYLAKGLTEKGEAFLSKAEGGSAVTEADLDEAGRLARESEAKITRKVPTDRLKEKKQRELFDAPFWDEVAFGCINCGTCTFLCPTCWCFDIQDEVQGKEGVRMRNWDSCMFPLFTLHGSGHNPRDEKYQRVRQRFMHKLKYYVDKYEDGIQCTGCGRCVRYCPANIDIRRVCELMNNY